MITDGKKWHYLAVTNLSALLQGNSSNHEGDFYCSNCFNSYTTKNSCHIETPKWVEKISKYNPGEKSLKAPFAIYLDLECLLKKEQSRENNNNNSRNNNNNNSNNNSNNSNNLEKYYAEKKARHETSG